MNSIICPKRLLYVAPLYFAHTQCRAMYKLGCARCVAPRASADATSAAWSGHALAVGRWRGERFGRYRCLTLRYSLLLSVWVDPSAEHMVPPRSHSCVSGTTQDCLWQYRVKAKLGRTTARVRVLRALRGLRAPG